MKLRDFRFGLSEREHDASSWAAKAHDAEARGFSTLLVADHLVATFEPFPALAAAAAATTTLRLGTYVLNNDLRHPVGVAREALTVDALCGGRFELGLGAGHMRSEYDEVGIPFDDGATRVDRLEEAVEVIEPMLRGDTTTFAGEHYRVAGHAPFPAPAQAPRMPLLVGGNGRRVHALAARRADVVGFVGFTHRDGGVRVDLGSFGPERLDEQVAAVRAAAGERFAQLELNALVQQVTVADDPEAGAAAFAERTGLAVRDLLASPYVLIGPAEKLADDLIERRERFGISYWVVFGAAKQAMTTVMEALARRT